MERRGIVIREFQNQHHHPIIIVDANRLNIFQNGPIHEDGDGNWRNDNQGDSRNHHRRFHVPHFFGSNQHGVPNVEERNERKKKTMMGRIRRTFRRMYMAITFTARTVRYISFRRRFRRNDHNNNNLLDILRNGEEFGLDQNQVNFWNLLNAGDEFDGYNNQLLLDIGMVHRRLEAADLSDEDDDGSHVLRPPHHHSYRGFIEKATGKVRLLSEMREIVGKPYYFGNIDRFEAEKIMTDLSNGSFLLRESKNPNKKLTITFRKDNLTLHARVEYSGGMFSCDNLDARFPRGPSVLQFIDECIRRRECHLYEPYVKVPVNRKNVLPLKMIAGASVVSLLKEANDIDGLELPTTLKNDLRGCSYPEICLMNSDRSILRPFLLGEDD